MEQTAFNTVNIIVSQDTKKYLLFFGQSAHINPYRAAYPSEVQATVKDPLSVTKIITLPCYTLIMGTSIATLSFFMLINHE